MSTENLQIISKLASQRTLSIQEWEVLLTSWDEEDRKEAARLARELTRRIFGNRIFVRGLVEFSNYCGNDCLYCGLRASNRACTRFRLSEDEIPWFPCSMLWEW